MAAVVSETYRYSQKAKSPYRTAGLPALLDRLQKNDPELTAAELTGWSHVRPKLLALSLKENTVLTSLSLQACRLGDEGVKILSRVLHNPPLVRLDLSGNAITDTSATALADAMCRCTRLEVLVLCWNGIADRGAQALASVLSSESRLHRLDLSGTLDGPGGGRRESGLTSEQLLRGNCHIGDVGAQALADSLAASRIQELCLNRQCRLTVSGVSAIAKQLHQLVHLELKRIPVDDDGAMALARFIPDSHLQTLDLSINTIKDKGAAAIATAIRNNATLESICLSQNSIGLNGLIALEHAASTNTVLTRLEVYGHVAGKDGSSHVWKIRPWLGRNRTIHALLQRPVCSLYAHCISKLSFEEDRARLYRLIRNAPSLFQQRSCHG